MDDRARRVHRPARRARHARGAVRDLDRAHARAARQAGRRVDPDDVFEPLRAQIDELVSAASPGPRCARRSRGAGPRCTPSTSPKGPGRAPPPQRQHREVLESRARSRSRDLAAWAGRREGTARAAAASSGMASRWLGQRLRDFIASFSMRSIAAGSSAPGRTSISPASTSALHPLEPALRCARASASSRRPDRGRRSRCRRARPRSRGSACSPGRVYAWHSFSGMSTRVLSSPCQTMNLPLMLTLIVVERDAELLCEHPVVQPVVGERLRAEQPDGQRDPLARTC